MTGRRTMAIAAGVVSAAMAAAIISADTPQGPSSRPAAYYSGQPNNRMEPSGEMSPLGEQQETELLKALKDRRPEAYEMLTNLRKKDPARYHQELYKAWRWHKEWQQQPPDVKQSMAAEQNARVKLYEAAQAYHDAGPNSPDQSKLKAQVAAMAAEHFGAEQKTLELKLARLEKQMAEVSADLKSREEHRDQIIADRVEHFLQHRPQGGATSRPVEP